MIFKSKKKIKVGIIGGAGYGGTELIKLLLFHPNASLTFVTSRKYSGVRVSDVHRFLRRATDLQFVSPEIEKIPSNTDLIFLATPHGISMELVPQIIQSMPKVKIIDLSGDFRLDNPLIYREFYDREHSSPELLEKFVYGLTELNRPVISRAQYVANPGCFATGIIFALYPLFRSGVVKDSVSVVSVTGSSGSGELPKEVTHHPVRAKNFKAYKILEHQHIPEIERFFRDSFSGWDFRIGLVPQSGPFVRGIFTTAVCYNPEKSERTVMDAFTAAYGKEKFVRIVGSSPEVTMVYATNYVEVSWVCRRDFIVAMSAIDNLVKGASGQAVQNMNVMCGFAEDAGIQYPGMVP
jgi:N-acetyl-gamma-glutamyl-phosphate reductase